MNHNLLSFHSVMKALLLIIFRLTLRESVINYQASSLPQGTKLILRLQQSLLCSAVLKGKAFSHS